MKGKAAVSMVMQVTKVLGWDDEESVVYASAFYNSGKWTEWADKDTLEDLIKDYREEIVDPMVMDLCLDILSGRLHPNLFINKIRAFEAKSKLKGK